MDRVLFFMLMLLVFSFSMLVAAIVYVSLVKGFMVRAEIEQADSVIVSGRLVLLYQGPVKHVDIRSSRVFILPSSLIVIELAPQPLANIVISYSCKNHTLKLKNLLVERLVVAGADIHGGIIRLRNLTLANVTLDATNLTLYVPSYALKYALIDFGAEKVRVAKVSMKLRMLECYKDGEELVIDGVAHTIKTSALYVKLGAMVVMDVSELRMKAGTVVLLSGLATVISSLLTAAYTILRSYELR